MGKKKSSPAVVAHQNGALPKNDQSDKAHEKVSLNASSQSAAEVLTSTVKSQAKEKPGKEKSGKEKPRKEKKGKRKVSKTNQLAADKSKTKIAAEDSSKKTNSGKVINSKPLKTKKLSKKLYKKELRRLQIELVKLQYWVKAKGLKVAILFEGRDAAGKGGAIQRIAECLNPRICRIVALGTPTEREKTQWYFQRYVAQLPAAGEMVLFDRSWYNRAGVERVMGFCSHQEYVEFLRSCPEFEHMLQRSGIILIKYWFSVSDEAQEERFQERLKNPTKRWKLSPMDLEARARWVDYSRAKDDMFAATDTTRSPWHVVEADDKKRARLNCISHLLSQIPYEDLTPKPMKLPKRQQNIDYERPPMEMQSFVPDLY